EFSTKRLIDFSSGTSAKEIKKTCVSDREALTFIHSGQKTKFGHSEDRFFKLEDSSKDVVDEEKYSNSVFRQLLKKKANLSKIKNVKCFGVKFFSRYDVCGDCQQMIIDHLREDGGLRKDFTNSLK